MRCRGHLSSISVFDIFCDIRKRLAPHVFKGVEQFGLEASHVSRKQSTSASRVLDSVVAFKFQNHEHWQTVCRMVLHVHFNDTACFLNTAIGTPAASTN